MTWTAGRWMELRGSKHPARGRASTPALFRKAQNARAMPALAFGGASSQTKWATPPPAVFLWQPMSAAFQDLVRGNRRLANLRRQRPGFEIRRCRGHTRRSGASFEYGFIAFLLKKPLPHPGRWLLAVTLTGDRGPHAHRVQTSGKLKAVTAAKGQRVVRLARF